MNTRAEESIGSTWGSYRAAGHASQVLLDAAAGADLLVVGSRGHGSFADALPRSVSQNCVHHARCPVLIMRSTGEA